MNDGSSMGEVLMGAHQFIHIHTLHSLEWVGGGGGGGGAGVLTAISTGRARPIF
jgi:hypothetical protein